jgi:hypothetical protein
MFRSSCLLPLLLMAVSSLLTGCGDGRTKMGLAPVEGTVICEGQPVPYATIYFEPLKQGKTENVGKQGIGYADDNGHFTISTYDRNDGAVVAKHRVRVGPALGENPRVACDCVLNEEIDAMEAEVIAGKTNMFEIKLRKATAKEKAQAAPLDKSEDD